MKAFDEFKSFMTKRNVVDLAVAVVIGGAVTTLVNSLVTNLVTPLIGIPGHLNFSSIAFTVHGSTFNPGLFLNAVISFIIITAVVFFLIVRPVDKVNRMAQSGKRVDPTTKTCPDCLSPIPIKAKRCAYCTSWQKR